MKPEEDKELIEERKLKLTAFKTRIKALVKIKLHAFSIISTSLQMLLMILVYVSKAKSSEIQKLEQEILILPPIEDA